MTNDELKKRLCLAGNAPIIAGYVSIRHSYFVIHVYAI